MSSSTNLSQPGQNASGINSQIDINALKDRYLYFKSAKVGDDAILLLLSNEFKLSQEQVKSTISSFQNNGEPTPQQSLAQQAPSSQWPQGPPPASVQSPPSVMSIPAPLPAQPLTQAPPVQVPSAPSPVPQVSSPQARNPWSQQQPAPPSSPSIPGGTPSTFTPPSGKFTLTDMAKKLNKPLSQLEEELRQTIQQFNVTEKGAMSILKGKYDFQLKRSGEPIELVGRLITMDGPREIKREKDGSQTAVSNIDFLIQMKSKDGTSVDLAQATMALWGDFAGKVSERRPDNNYNLFWNEAYRFKCSISGPNPQTRAYTLYPSAETIFQHLPDFKQLPSIQDMITPKQIKPLSDANKFVDTNAVFMGYVAKQIKSQAGVFFGLSISDDTIDTPMNVWCRGRIGELAELIPPGTKIIVMAYVSMPPDAESPSLSAKAIYSAPEGW